MSTADHAKCKSHRDHPSRKGLWQKCTQYCLQGSARADSLWTGWGKEQGADHWLPHNRKSPGSSEPKEVLLVSGTPHPLCCPDLRPGSSDSTLGPIPPAVAAVRRPRTATSLTHASSWLYPSCDHISSLNCSPPLSPAFTCYFQSCWQRISLPTYHADSGGTKGTHSHKCKNNSMLKPLLLRRAHTLKTTSGVEFQDPQKLNRPLCLTHRPK